MSIEESVGETNNEACGFEKKLVGQSNVTKNRYSPLGRQIIAGVGTILTTISAGMVIGFSAILLPEIQHPDSRIQITDEIASWIASVASLPMAFGCLLGGVFMERFGRKTTHLILNVPFVIGWCTISMSESVCWLLIGRVLTGFCVGLLSPIGPAYLSEVTDPKHRGFFLASITLAIAVGVLLTHFMAILVAWHVNAIVCAILPFFSYIFITFVPESPSWLLREGRVQEAFQAFQWLRGCGEAATKEFDSMVDTQLKHHESINAENQPHEAIQLRTIIEQFQKMIADKSFTTPLIILSVYFATLQFSGANAVTFYTVSILKDSLGANINEYTATLIIDLVRLIASLIACAVVKSAGRRPLTVCSGTATALGLLGLSMYLHLANENPHLREYASIPLILFAIYILAISVGISPLPWCLTGELFPLRYRAIGSAFVTFFNFVCFFTVVKTSPSLFATYGSSNTFGFYGVLTLAGTAILMSLLPETKNKSLQEIEDNYTAERKHKISRNKVQP